MPKKGENSFYFRMIIKKNKINISKYNKIKKKKIDYWSVNLIYMWVEKINMLSKIKICVYIFMSIIENCAISYYNQIGKIQRYA